MTPQWKSALRSCVIVTRALFEAGRPVAEHVRGRLRYELRATWAGGLRILDKVEALEPTRPQPADDREARPPGWRRRRCSENPDGARRNFYYSFWSSRPRNAKRLASSGTSAG